MLSNRRPRYPTLPAAVKSLKSVPSLCRAGNGVRPARLPVGAPGVSQELLDYI
jgi:hypothetical protein